MKASLQYLPAMLLMVSWGWYLDSWEAAGCTIAILLVLGLVELNGDVEEDENDL